MQRNRSAIVVVSGIILAVLVSLAPAHAAPGQAAAQAESAVRPAQPAPEAAAGQGINMGMAERVQLAETFFRDGMKLIKEGQTARACRLFDASLKLDPAMGTRYRLAECYESTGRLSHAYQLFVEVAEQARREAMVDREELAMKRAADLAQHLGRIVIGVPKQVASLAALRITLDGVELKRADWESGPRIVERGDHVIAATAPGYASWKRTVSLNEGATIDVNVPVLARMSAPVQEAEDTSTWTARKTAGAAFLGVGIASVVAGATAGAIVWTSDEDEGEWSGVLAGLTLAGGPVLSLVGVVLLAGDGPSGKRDSRAGWKLAPAVGPRLVGGTFRAAF